MRKKSRTRGLRRWCRHDLDSESSHYVRTRVRTQLQLSRRYSSSCYCFTARRYCTARYSVRPFIRYTDFKLLTYTVYQKHATIVSSKIAYREVAGDTNKFSLLVDFDLLKRAKSRNQKPEIELHRCSRHFQNREDVVTLQWAVLFG